MYIQRGAKRCVGKLDIFEIVRNILQMTQNDKKTTQSHSLSRNLAFNCAMRETNCEKRIGHHTINDRDFLNKRK
jgi:hypothetical protein